MPSHRPMLDILCEASRLVSLPKATHPLHEHEARIEESHAGEGEPNELQRLSIGADTEPSIPDGFQIHAAMQEYYVNEDGHTSV